MSVVSDLVDALKSLFGGGQRKVDIEIVRSEGGLGSVAGTNAIEPQRPSPGPDRPGDNIDAGDMTLKSADPEEGGEYTHVDD